MNNEEKKLPADKPEKDPYKDDITSHEYDGIKELNNKAPAWIVIMFLATIAFAGIYAIRYLGYPENNMDQTSEYERNMAKAEAEKQVLLKARGESDMNLEDMVAEGGKLFLEKGCIACHGQNGEGNAVGPNLTDNYWLHGCSEQNIIKIITNGVPEKGMTPYKTMMSANQIKKLTAYVQTSLVGSNPENGKDPQGEECK